MNRNSRGLVGGIRRHPLSAFLLWFFTVGQVFAFAPLIVDTRVPTQWFINGSTLIGLLLPTIVITWIVDGPEGVRELGRRIGKVRGSLAVYAVGVIVLPVLTVAMALGLVGPPDVPTSTALAAIGSALIASTVVGFVLNNLWEEVAWMGFVQARLQARHGALRAAVVTGPLFALQHLALLVQNGIVLAVVILVIFSLAAILYRAFNAWMYNRTESLFLVGLVHALGNAVAPGSGLFPGYLRVLYPDDAELVGVLHLAAFCVLGVLVIAVTRGRLGLPARGRRTADHDPSVATAPNS